MHYWTIYALLIQYRLRSTVRCQEISYKLSPEHKRYYAQFVDLTLEFRQYMFWWEQDKICVLFGLFELRVPRENGAVPVPVVQRGVARWCPALEKRQRPRRVEVGHCLLRLHHLDLWTSHYETCSIWAVVVSYFSFLRLASFPNAQGRLHSIVI